MKVLDSSKKNFDKLLDNLLMQRKRKVQSSSVSVTNIIKDVKKNGDKALLKYEKKFNKNSVIKPSSNQIQKSIKSLRDYKLGVVFTDEYGRETPILISESGGFKVDKVDSTKSNMLVASLDGGFPANMAYFKFFIKN